MKLTPILSLFLCSNCSVTPTATTEKILKNEGAKEVLTLQQQQRQEIGNYAMLMMQMV